MADNLGYRIKAIGTLRYGRWNRKMKFYRALDRGSALALINALQFRLQDGQCERCSFLLLPRFVYTHKYSQVTK